MKLWEIYLNSYMMMNLNFVELFETLVLIQEILTISEISDSISQL